jgi:hypothetical protein
MEDRPPRDQWRNPDGQYRNRVRAKPPHLKIWIGARHKRGSHEINAIEILAGTRNFPATWRLCDREVLVHRYRVRSTMHRPPRVTESSPYRLSFIAMVSIVVSYRFHGNHLAALTSPKISAGLHLLSSSAGNPASVVWHFSPDAWFSKIACAPSAVLATLHRRTSGRRSGHKRIIGTRLYSGQNHRAAG